MAVWEISSRADEADVDGPKRYLPEDDRRFPAPVHWSLTKCYNSYNSVFLHRSIESGKLLINRQHLSCYGQDILLSIYLTEKITFPHRHRKPFPFYEITFLWANGPRAENEIKRELQYGAEQWNLLSSRERQTDSSLLYADTVNKWAQLLFTVISSAASVIRGIQCALLCLKSVVVLIISASNSHPQLGHLLFYWTFHYFSHYGFGPLFLRMATTFST